MYQAKRELYEINYNHLKDHLTCRMSAPELLKSKHEWNVEQRAKYVIKRPKQDLDRVRAGLSENQYTGDVIDEWWDNKLIRRQRFNVYRDKSDGMRYDSTRYELTTSAFVKEQGDIPDNIWKGKWKGMKGMYYDHESPSDYYAPPYQDGDWGIYKEDVSKLQDEYTEYLYKSKMSSITSLERYVDERKAVLETAIQNLQSNMNTLKIQFAIDRTGAFQNAEVLKTRCAEKVQEIQEKVRQVASSQRSVAATLVSNHEMPDVSIAQTGMSSLLRDMEFISRS
jgi:exonuclease VII small subunit